jgi:solute carrier family 25 phosphate transporter 3
MRPPPEALHRRKVLAAVGAAAGFAAVTDPLSAAAQALSASTAAQQPQQPAAELVWQPRSANAPRSEKTSYQPTFITYLARFLLNYDKGSANWYRDQGKGLPVSLSRQEIKRIREKQFGQFSESVEVGLQNYQGVTGVRALFSLLRSRYGASAAAKVQLALLFSLIRAQNQPSDLIRTALGEADGGSVSAVELLSRGSGYSGPTPPTVTVTAPDAGQEPAVIRAELEPTGGVASVRLRSGGGGYVSVPAVSISPPLQGGSPAQAVAQVDNGRVVGLTLTSPGSGYTERDIASLRVDIEPPRDEQADVPLTDGVTAEADGFLGRTVARLVVESGGGGYARDQPLEVSIAPPQACGGEADGVAATARVSLGGLSDLEALAGGGPYATLYPASSVSSEVLQLLPDSLRPIRKPNGALSFPTAAAYSKLLIQPSQAADEAAAAREAIAAAAAEAEGSPPPGGLLSRLPFSLSFGQRDPTFGPLGTSPVQKEVSLGPAQYLAFGASGAVCTSLVRAALVPLDVSKTLMQSDPDAYPATAPALASLWKQGGLPSLYRSWDVTAVGGLFLGGFGFGFNEFLRRYLTGLAGPQAQTLYSLQISIAAALGSVLVTCLATCPFEVVRIRAINAGTEASSGAGPGAEPGAEPGVKADAESGAVASAEAAPAQAAAGRHAARGGRDPYSALNGVGTLYAEGGLPLLYSALQPLLLRELPFTVTKFLVYDASTQAIAAAIPSIQEGPYASLLSLLGGLAAGVVAAAVSTPADTLLTLGQQSGGKGEDAEEVTLPGLFRGLLPRCVFFGALIAGQFLLYDDLKRVFKVAPDDILYVLDVFADRLSFYDVD